MSGPRRIEVSNVVGIRTAGTAKAPVVQPVCGELDRHEIIDQLPEILGWAVAGLVDEFGYEENTDNAIGLTIRLLAVTADRLRICTA